MLGKNNASISAVSDMYSLSSRCITVTTICIFFLHPVSLAATLYRCPFTIWITVTVSSFQTILMAMSRPWSNNNNWREIQVKYLNQQKYCKKQKRYKGFLYQHFFYYPTTIYRNKPNLLPLIQTLLIQ